MPDEPSSEIEIYPMPSFPTLAVSDIRASAAWYCEAAGFTRVFSMSGPGDIPSLVALRLRWVKYADLLLFPEREGFLSAEGAGRGSQLLQLKHGGSGLDRAAMRPEVLAPHAWRPCDPCPAGVRDPCRAHPKHMPSTSKEFYDRGSQQQYWLRRPGDEKVISSI
jgi:hypothetical protein